MSQVPLEPQKPTTVPTMTQPTVKRALPIAAQILIWKNVLDLLATLQTIYPTQASMRHTLTVDGDKLMLIVYRGTTWTKIGLEPADFQFGGEATARKVAEMLGENILVTSGTS